MPDHLLRYLLLGVLAIALVIAAATDIRRREIDNWLTGGIAALAPLFWWASGMALWPDVAWQVGDAAAVFAIALALFAVNQMGGGDVKLLTALGLWIAPAWFGRLLAEMALIGAVLTVAMIFAHFAQRRPRKLPRLNRAAALLALAAAVLAVAGNRVSPGLSRQMLEMLAIDAAMVAAFLQFRSAVRESGWAPQVPYGVAISGAGLWTLAAQFGPLWLRAIAPGAAG